MQSTQVMEEIRSVLIGVAVGDALGVPFEFTSRVMMRKHPCTVGGHRQPCGEVGVEAANINVRMQQK